MSLKAIHIFFITVSAAMFFGIAFFRLAAWRETGETVALLHGAGWGLGGVGLVIYGIGFLRKYRKVGSVL